MLKIHMFDGSVPIFMVKSLELSPFLLLRPPKNASGHRVQHCKGPSVRQQRLQTANDHLIQV